MSEHLKGILDGIVWHTIFVCAVLALPTPKETSNMFYVWVFRFFHSLILAFPRLFVSYQVEEKAKEDDKSLNLKG
jgi:hypothetical protein